jgi:hypothetical protein
VYDERVAADTAAGFQNGELVMAKAFKKGDRVTVISSWDSKGTVSVRHATVHSCGVKVLRLTCDITGDEFGHDRSPVVAAPGECGVHPFIDEASLEAAATVVAIAYIEKQKAHFDDCIARNRDGNHHYLRHMAEEKAAIHEPRVSMWADLWPAELRGVKS